MDEWAARHRRLRNPGGGYSGPWDSAIAPHLNKPMRGLSDPLVAEVDVMGGSQAGKTEIGNNWLAWQIDIDPADTIVCQSDKAMAQEFSEKRVGQLLSDHARLREKQLPEQGADNIFRKMFRGMNLYNIWPVAAQFRQRPVPRGWLDEYDQYDDDIEGQGDALQLLFGRQTTFEGREKVLVTSSPSRPDGSGIEARVEGGTNERWHWPCPHCGEHFSPETDKHLKFRREGTADDAAASAHLVCPANGCIIEPREKRAMHARGVWLQPHQSISADGVIAGEPSANRRWSFRFDGLFGFLSWGALAREWFEAEREFEARQDESKLVAFWNTRIGKNYRSKLAEAPRTTTEELLNRVEEGWRLGTVPAGVRVLTGAIDVQKGRFVCAVWGWAENGESWLVDRFEYFQAPDGLSALDPASYLEHWQVLMPLFQRRWPMAADPAVTVPVLGWALDTGGEAGVHDNAYKFWTSARGLGVTGHQLTLIKGGNTLEGPLLSASLLEKKTKGGPRKTGVQLWIPNVHKLKDVLDARLRRTKPGAGYVHLPEGLAEPQVAEFTAEEKHKGKWVKIRARNEMIDLYVYGSVVLLRPGHAQQRVDMGWVPEWARVPVIREVAAESPEVETAPAAVVIAAQTLANERRSPDRDNRQDYKLRRRGWLRK